MNDKLKDAQQKEIILKYNNTLKQLVDGTYNNIKSSNEVSQFSSSIEQHMGVLNEIKDEILLESDQKDQLYQDYYNLLIDGCESITDVNQQKDVRKMIFSHVKDKKLFRNQKIALEFIKSHFKQEMDEMIKKMAEMQQTMLKQQLEQQRQLQQAQLKQQEQFPTQNKMIGQDVGHPQVNTMMEDNQMHVPNQLANVPQKVQGINDMQVVNPMQNIPINFQNNNMVMPPVDQMQVMSQNYNNIGYTNNIFNKLTSNGANRNNLQQNGYAQASQVNWQENMPQQPLFGPDDFYRYKNISNAISQRAKKELENNYNFIKNEIKNSKTRQMPVNNNEHRSDDNLAQNVDKKNNNMLLTQKPKINIEMLKKIYNKQNKDLKNGIGGDNKDQLMDANSAINATNAPSIK